MSGKSSLVHVRFSDKLLIKLDLEIETFNAKQPSRPHTRSSWVREAVEMQLEIARQRRRVRGPKKYVCKVCGRKIAQGEIASKLDRLDGIVEYVCDKCETKAPRD